MDLKIRVGLEEGAGGAVIVHAFDVPGCTASGDDANDALDAFTRELSRWLDALAALGQGVPPADAELEIAVDEWLATGADIGDGESTACFEADRVPLDAAEVERLLQRLGDLRGRLLAALRGVRDADLDAVRVGPWTLRRVLDELARAQWWLLSRLGASPLAEVPDRTLGRLDTAMALVVQKFTEMGEQAEAIELELEGEHWTPRKVMRRLLWVEWTLGNAAIEAIGTHREEAG